MKNKVNISNREFKVFPEKGIIVCILQCDTQIEDFPFWYIFEHKLWKRLHKVDHMGRFTVTAKAKCGENDVFDEVIGKRIAESRAKCKAYATASKLWNIYKTKLYEMADFCTYREQGCSHARAMEAKHVIELCNQ